LNAVVFRIGKDMTNPPIELWCEDDIGVVFLGTGVLSAKFFMAPINDDGSLGTLVVSAGVMTITATSPQLKLKYQWVAGDTATVGNYATWAIAYKGAGDTLGQLFDGPEVEVYTPGTKLVR